MTSFLIALQFLTIIPVRYREFTEKNVRRSMFYFPVVGLILGLFLGGIDQLISPVFPELLVNLLLVTLLIFITGGLHLDGLADTVDALGSHRSREEMLRIMKDSRIGVMGTLALITVLLYKISLLSLLPSSLKFRSLILMLTASRWVLLLPLLLFPYARSGEGKAQSFFEQIDPAIASGATIFTLTVSLTLFSYWGLFLLIGAGLLVLGFGKYIHYRVGGLTGDSLGASAEIAEIIILLGICLLTKLKAGIFP